MVRDFGFLFVMCLSRHMSRRILRQQRTLLCEASRAMDSLDRNDAAFADKVFAIADRETKQSMVLECLKWVFRILVFVAGFLVFQDVLHHLQRL